jgi:FkbM family methyltransferase
MATTAWALPGNRSRSRRSCRDLASRGARIDALRRARADAPATDALSWLPRATSRFRHHRVVRSAAWRLGESLGPRVLFGRTPSGSPIALLMADYQHRHLYFFAGEYEPEVSALVSALVRPGDTVFDVGANAGYFSLLARDLGARAFAFEPNPVALRLLRRSVAADGRGVTVIASACSDRDGTATLYPHSIDNTGMSSVTKPGARKIRVATVALDGFAESRGLAPALLKIDVEGHELAVIAGAEGILRNARPVAVIETACHETFDVMSKLGYDAWRITPAGNLLPHPGVIPAGYENVCFAPRERGLVPQ